jgi:hypothetical protein
MVIGAPVEIRLGYLLEPTFSVTNCIEICSLALELKHANRHNVPIIGVHPAK